MQTPAIAVCLLQCLLPVFVLADNVALNPPDVLRDGNYTSCKPVTWADFTLRAYVNVTHIRVYTTETQHVTVETPCKAQPIRSPSFVDFFCAEPVKTNRIYISNLTGSTCEIEVGTCPIGSDGKRYYGADCREPCSDFCHAGLCDSNRGTCPSCVPGTTGSYCDEACSGGYYGLGCRDRCPSCGQPGCDPVTGDCIGLCSAGRWGPRCEKVCASGTFGRGNRTSCPHSCSTCRASTCYASDGQCYSGCVAGYQNKYCNQTCDDGTFGDCRQQCACRNSSEVCNKHTGLCQSGCRDGRMGDNCQQECPDGFFGTCTIRCLCRDAGEACDKETGDCQSGCPDGRSGSNCYDCQAGVYGENCDRTCNCRNSTESCDAATGVCTSGCPTGWQGSDCRDKCMDSVFGDDCGSTCQRTCANNSCHHVTGHCTLGCVEGWEGDFCTKQKPPVVDVGQVFNTGLGLGLGVGMGTLLLVVVVILLAAFCFWRRLQKHSALATVETHQLGERDVYERVDEEAGSAARLSADASAKEEEENWYEKIEGAEDQPPTAAAPVLATVETQQLGERDVYERVDEEAGSAARPSAGIKTNLYEGLDSITMDTSPSAPYEQLPGAGAVVSPRVYENRPEVATANPDASSDYVNRNYQNLDS